MQKKSENDIVQDILARVQELQAKRPDKPLTDDLIKKIDVDVRRQWGGDRPYISIKPGDGHSERNSRIYREYLKGERVEFLMRRHNLSKPSICRIIAAARSNGVK